MTLRLATATALSLVVLTACPTRPPVDDAGPTCSLAGLEANPAGLHRSGSVGGVALSDDPGVPTSHHVGVASIAAGIAAVFAPTDAQQDVVLLVADDFGALHAGGASAYTVDPAVFELRYQEYLLEHPVLDVPYPDWLRARLEQLQAAGALSHGAFVLTHVLDLFSALGAALVSDDGGRIVLALAASTVVVQAVEVGGLDATQVAGLLASVVDAERAEGRTAFVVNMSFTLEPCDAVRAFREDGADSFDPYLKATPPSIGPGDPLHDLIHEDTRDTVFVAAAGNFGGPAPRQPGRMPEVASVSASVGSGADVHAESNRAEVRAPGLWIPLGNPYGRNGAAMTGAVLLGGTSLAAPAVAVASVLDVAAVPARCADPMAGTLLAHGDYDDLALPGAVDAHCM